MRVKFYDSDPLLKDYILMFSYSELSPEELSKTKFLPDNVTSLTLFLNEEPFVKDHFSGNTVRFRVAFAGQYSVPVLYSSVENIRIVNVDFRPWGAYSIFGIPQSPLHNVTSDATRLFPSLTTFLPDLLSRPGNEDLCVQVLQEFLISELKSREKRTDERIVLACEKISATAGNILVHDVCKEIGMSHSTLTNYFSEMIGITPKLFGRITRFTAVQKFLGENPNAGWSDIVHRFHYFDQNHFIREFKQFTGAVPKNRRQWEALFDPLKKAIEEGFHSDPKQMQHYRNTSLYQILHYVQRDE